MMVRGMDLASATDMADMADRTTVATRAFILLLLCIVVGVEEQTGCAFLRIGFLWRESEIYQSYERVYSTIPTCHQSQRSVGSTTPFGRKDNLVHLRGSIFLPAEMKSRQHQKVGDSFSVRSGVFGNNPSSSRHIVHSSFTFSFRYLSINVVSTTPKEKSSS